MSGYQDWDHVVAGTLLPLIYQGETVWEHCGPTTIARADAHMATELAKKEGLPHYKERRVHIASSETCLTSSESPAQKAPSVKSKVTVPPQARSSLSGEGSLVVALDQPSGSEEEVHLQEPVATMWFTAAPRAHIWTPCGTPLNGWSSKLSTLPIMTSIGGSRMDQGAGQMPTHGVEVDVHGWHGRFLPTFPHDVKYQPIPR